MYLIVHRLLYSRPFTYKSWPLIVSDRVRAVHDDVTAGFEIIDAVVPILQIAAAKQKRSVARDRITARKHKTVLHQSDRQCDQIGRFLKK